MLPLEPTDDLARPAFKDAASCEKWLSQLQLTNLNLAQATLRKQLDELNRCSLRGSDRLQTLETLRETVAAVQRDFAKKLAGKKLPLTEEEFTLLIALSSLWQGMLNGYLRCLQSAETGDKQLAGAMALLCQRALLYGGLQLEEFIHAGYEPGAKLWQQFHALYAQAESLNLQGEPVPDALYQPGIAVDSRALYAKTLLMHRVRLAGLTHHQSQTADRWLSRWSEMLHVELRAPAVSKEDAPPFAVDLAGAHGLQTMQHAKPVASWRFLPMVPLSKQIRVKTILLQQGQTPQQVELGADITSKDCLELLNKLHAYWCEPRADSLADSPRPCPSFNVCVGMEQIYAQLSGKPFKPVNDSSVANKEAQRQIETFGRVLENNVREGARELGFVPEEWLIEEDGLLRGRLLRLQTAGTRLGPHQIVSVFAPNSAEHKLGIIDFVRVTLHGQLYIGAHYLPGHPQSLVMRSNQDHDHLLSGSAVALLLPALDKLRIPASLVIPREWFRSERKVELNLPENVKQSVALGFSVEKGVDYERVSFKPLA